MTMLLGTEPFTEDKLKFLMAKYKQIDKEKTAFWKTEKYATNKK